MRRMLLALIGVSFCSSLALAEQPQRTAGEYLKRWARGAGASESVDFDQYMVRYGEEYPEHVLRHAAAFFGPVDVEGLQTAFRWSVVEVRENEVRLQAIARTQPAQASEAPKPDANGKQAEGSMSFEVVLALDFPEPKLVKWLGPQTESQRDAVERLYPAESGLGPHRAGRPELFGGAGTSRNVVQASATLAAGELAANGVNPAVLEILSRWEKASSEIQSVEIDFRRIDRDHVFQVETRGVGKFVYARPNLGLYELKPAAVVERAEGPTTASGGRMAVAAAKPQLFWWSGEAVTVIDHREKTYDTLPIPRRVNENIQTVGSWDVVWQVMAGPQKVLPGVVDIKAERLLSRFEWTVDSEEGEPQIHLEGVPRATNDRRHIKRLSVMLDAKTFRTTATRLVDPAGSRETIHTFEYVRVNEPELADINSWKPSLADLSPVGPPPLAPAVEELPGTPTPQ